MKLNEALNAEQKVGRIISGAGAGVEKWLKTGGHGTWVKKSHPKEVEEIKNLSDSMVKAAKRINVLSNKIGKDTRAAGKYF